MKQTILFILTTLLLGFGGKGEMRVCTLTPTPQMHCQSCVEKITNGLKHEKGITKIECDLNKQTVSVWYKGNKNSPEKLQKALKKVGYETVVVGDVTETEYAATKKGGCGSGGGKCGCGSSCKCSGCAEHGKPAAGSASSEAPKKSCCSK